MLKKKEKQRSESIFITWNLICTVFTIFFFLFMFRWWFLVFNLQCTFSQFFFYFFIFFFQYRVCKSETVSILTFCKKIKNVLTILKIKFRVTFCINFDTTCVCMQKNVFIMMSVWIRICEQNHAVIIRYTFMMICFRGFSYVVIVI